MDECSNNVKENRVSEKTDIERTHTVDADYNSIHLSNMRKNPPSKNFNASHIMRITRREATNLERRCRSLETNHDIGGKYTRKLRLSLAYEKMDLYMEQTISIIYIYTN